MKKEWLNNYDYETLDMNKKVSYGEFVELIQFSELIMSNLTIRRWSKYQPNIICLF